MGGSGGRSGRAERSGGGRPPPPPRLLLGAERVPESGSSEKNFATCGRKPGSLAPPQRASCWLSPLAARGGSRGPCRGHGSPGKAPLSPPLPASALRGKRLRGAPRARVSVWLFFWFSLHFLPPDSPPSAHPPRLCPRPHGKLTHFLRGLRIYPTSSLLPSSFPFKTRRKKKKGPCDGLSSVL